MIRVALVLVYLVIATFGADSVGLFSCHGERNPLCAPQPEGSVAHYLKTGIDVCLSILDAEYADAFLVSNVKSKMACVKGLDRVGWNAPEGYEAKVFATPLFGNLFDKLLELVKTKGLFSPDDSTTAEAIEQYFAILAEWRMKLAMMNGGYGRWR